MIESITIMNRLFWPRRLGGLENVLWQITNVMAEQGTRVQVLTEQVDDLIEFESARDNLDVSRTPPPEFGRLWRIAELLQVRWWMQSIRSAPRTQWYFANEPTAAAAAILLGLSSQLIFRPVFCFAGMHHIAHTHPEMAGFTRSLIARRLDRFAHRYAKLLLTQSRNLQMQQERWYSPKVNSVIIPNAAKLASNDAPTTQHARKSLGLGPQDFVVGFVGRPADPCKDLPFLIDALKQTNAINTLRLLIVGDGEGMDTAHQWVNDAGIGDRTTWTGNLTDTAPAYRAMDVLVLPSRFETFGNVIAEAHAHGTPAIGRRFLNHPTKPIYTACEELIDPGETGYTVDPHDPSDLASKLDHLATHPELTAQMGMTAATRRAEYQWPDMVGRLTDTLEQLPTQK